MKKDSDIKNVEFIFENCETLLVPYDKFQSINIQEKNNIHFRIEGFNVYGVDRLSQYNDITSIRLYNYKGDMVYKIYVGWEDGDEYDNSFQIDNEIDHNKGIYDISISERKYLDLEINKLNKTIKNSKERLEYILQRLTSLD